MRWLTLLIPTLVIQSVWTKMRMIQFYGQYETGYFTDDGSADYKGYVPSNNCSGDCYNDATCAAYKIIDPDYCEFATTNSELWIDMNLEAGGNQIIGIKTDIPEDTCPANYTQVDFKMVSPEGIFSWKLYPTGYWMFKMCWKDWSRFERSDGNVACIRVVYGSGLTKEQLNYECYAHNAPYYASLAGVYTVEESVWMREEAAKHSNGQPLNYWISGVRDGTCEGTDPHDMKAKFKWEDNMTTSSTALTEANAVFSCKIQETENNCLVIMSQSSQIISDINCDTTFSIGGGFCIYELHREVKV
ncbi:hypothetical protein CAEBREN_00491 [Caenorhabditis brenneri]|uniref:PAN-3 domain-containing protein n=1 Tax=Caenorhabditis brenneri TaxID=135651 RepID=G0NPB4_CAEBE|nr:hypothetical protein CAEBREN_00491 [Caenorhabditis brenneri]